MAQDDASNGRQVPVSLAIASAETVQSSSLVPTGGPVDSPALGGGEQQCEVDVFTWMGRARVDGSCGIL